MEGTPSQCLEHFNSLNRTSYLFVATCVASTQISGFNVSFKALLCLVGIKATIHGTNSQELEMLEIAFAAELPHCLGTCSGAQDRIKIEIKVLL